MTDADRNTGGPAYVGSKLRLSWAMRLGAWPKGLAIVDPTIEKAREVCREAEISLATLFLPDPTRRQMLVARIVQGMRWRCDWRHGGPCPIRQGEACHWCKAARIVRGST